MGKIPMGFDVLTIVLLIGGVLGSVLRVVTSKDQSTFSRASIVDVITGGLVGILFPAFYTFDDWWTILQRGAAVALVSYVSSDLVTSLKARFLPTLLAPAPTRREGDPK